MTISFLRYAVEVLRGVVLLNERLLLLLLLLSLCIQFLPVLKLLFSLQFLDVLFDLGLAMFLSKVLASEVFADSIELSEHFICQFEGFQILPAAVPRNDLL